MITQGQPIKERLPKIKLLSGKHDSFEKGACLLELSGWLAGEETYTE